MKIEQKKFTLYYQMGSILVLLIIIFTVGILKFIDKNKTPKNLKQQMVDRPISYFISGITIERNSSIDRAGQPLPDSLIIKPGLYKVYGQNYQLEKEGLYRFLDPTKSNQQRIVYQEDTNALLSSIAWISAHGDEDDNDAPKELQKKAKTGKLSMLCGNLSLFAEYLLNSQKIKNRLVTTLTLDEWNSYDNGHTLIEVLIGNQWKVFDLDNNVVFTHDGRYLNFLDLSKFISSDDYSIEKIAEDPQYDIENSIGRSYDYSFYFEAILSDEKDLRAWYKRSFQVPMVEENADYYFFDETHREKVESYSSSYKYLPYEDFIKKFYQ